MRSARPFSSFRHLAAARKNAVNLLIQPALPINRMHALAGQSWGGTVRHDVNLANIRSQVAGRFISCKILVFRTYFVILSSIFHRGICGLIPEKARNLLSSLGSRVESRGPGTGLNRIKNKSFSVS